MAIDLLNNDKNTSLREIIFYTFVMQKKPTYLTFPFKSIISIF